MSDTTITRIEAEAALHVWATQYQLLMEERELQRRLDIDYTNKPLLYRLMQAQTESLCVGVALCTSKCRYYARMLEWMREEGAA